MIRRPILIFWFVLCAGTFPAALVAATTQQTVTVTSYAHLVQELAQDAQKCSLIHVSTIGYSAKVHRPILMVQLGVPSTGTPRIFILCRQHGDEPAGTEAALALVNEIAESKDSSKTLQSLCMYIVPMVNPDGAELLTRRSGVLADLNRDWGVFRQPETTAVQNAVAKVHPEFILDIHSWDMIDPFQQVCLEGPRGDQVNKSLLWSIAELQARAAYGLAAVSKQQVMATTYGEFSEPTLAHRFFLRSDHIASLLFETAPGQNFGISLTTRTALVETLLQWLIKDTRLHPDEWRRLASAEPPIPISPIQTPATLQSRITQALAPVKQLGFANVLMLSTSFVMLGWIVYKSRNCSVSSEVKSAARYRRYANTYFASLHSALPEDRKERLRQCIARCTLLNDVRYGSTLRTDPRSQNPGTTGTAGV